MKARPGNVPGTWKRTRETDLSQLEAPIRLLSRVVMIRCMWFIVTIIMTEKAPRIRQSNMHSLTKSGSGKSKLLEYSRRFNSHKYAWTLRQE